MTDLQEKAMRMALEALEKDPVPLNAINNAQMWLRQALAQPEQDTQMYFDGIPETKYTAPPKRGWVGLTKEDMPDGDNPMFDTNEFYAGMAWAAAKLKEKNT